MNTLRQCPARTIRGNPPTCQVANGACVFCHIPYEEEWGAPNGADGAMPLARSYQYEAIVDQPSEGEPTQFQSKVRTRGVRVPIPNGKGNYVEVGSESKDDGPWDPPYVKVASFRVREAEWRDLVRTVERGLVEYDARFPAKLPTDAETSASHTKANPAPGQRTRGARA